MTTFDASRSEGRLESDYSEQHPEAAFITTELRCASCDESLLGLSTLGMCPSCGTTVRATLIAIDKRRSSTRSFGAQSAAHCARCGYDLAGLEDDGACPECGTSIEASRSGALLQFASPEYLERVHGGAFRVVTSIILMLLGGFGAVAILFISAISQSATGALIGLLMLLLVPIGAAGWMWGWWMFSTRDPALEEGGESSSARKRSRIFLVAYLALFAGFIALIWVSPNFRTGRHGGMSATLALLGLGSYFASLVALVLQYVYSMLYVRWLALRLPDQRMADWAKTLTWLGPLIYIVGSLIVIGPLIALGFYWSLLDNMRREIKSTRRFNELEAKVFGPEV